MSVSFKMLRHLKFSCSTIDGQWGRTGRFLLEPKFKRDVSDRPGSGCMMGNVGIGLSELKSSFS